MAGRAGRRGKDKEGLVLYLPHREPVDPEDIRGIMSGGLAPLVSRMSFHYDFMLKALHKSSSESPDLMKRLLDNSYGAVQRVARKTVVDAEIVALSAQIAALGVTDDHRTTASEKAELDHDVATTRRGAHKKATEALAAWIAANPTWSATKALLDKERLLLRQKENLTVESEGYAAENDTRRFEPVLHSLMEGGYATATDDSYALTPLGVLATECNEANPLLLSYLYDSEMLKGAGVAEIVAALATFVVDREAIEKSHSVSELPSIIHDVIYAVAGWGEEGLATDDSCVVRSDPEYWCTTTLWVHIASLWLRGTTAGEICHRYDLMEGNLMKGLLKVNNIVREWKALATIRADVDMLLVLEDVESKLLHGLAVPESLYLRL
jgi:superfamily II RNA helicase